MYYYQGQTLSEYCKENGICYQAVWTRIKKGKSVEEAIHPHFNLMQHCIDNGVCYGSVRNLMSKGKTLEEAVEISKENAAKKIKLPDGRQLSQVCRENKILYNSVFYRVKVLGETPEQALNYFLEKQKNV